MLNVKLLFECNVHQNGAQHKNTEKDFSIFLTTKKSFNQD